MKECKCPNCGANLNIDENSDTSVCRYCNTSFSTKTALASTTTNNNSANVINYYYNNGSGSGNEIKVARKPRPKVNKFLAAILFLFYIVPGVIYVVYVKKAQQEWDDKYTY